MAAFIPVDGIYRSFFRRMTAVEAPPGEVRRYLRMFRRQPLDAPFFRARSRTRLLLPGLEDVVSREPEITFPKFCRRLGGYLGGKTGFLPSAEPQGRCFLQDISHRNRVSDRRAAELLRISPEGFSCREDLVNAVAAGTGLPPGESFRRLTAMFLLRFVPERGEHGIRCDSVPGLPVVERKLLTEFFPHEEIEVSPASIFPATADPALYWEVWPELPAPWEEVIRLEIWDHNFFHRRFRRFAPEQRWEILRIVRRRRLAFLAQLQAHAGLSRSDAEQILESLFFHAGKLYFTEEEIMTAALAIGYSAWGTRSGRRRRHINELLLPSDLRLR